MSVALASVAVAVLGGVAAVSWAGLVYLLIFPLQITNARVMDARRRKRGITAGSTDDQEAREDPDGEEP